MPDPYPLTVLDVVEETADARSVVLSVPAEHRGAFAHDPGQFLTVAVPGDGPGNALVARSYSLSSSPHEGLETVRFTVKGTRTGRGSRSFIESLRPGDELLVLPPAGSFTPRDLDADLLLLAGGSGVAPSMSILQAALARGHGQVVLVYANRDAGAVMFADRLAALEEQHPDRLRVVHWLEDERGLPTQEAVRAIAAQHLTYDAFVCGPAPFMEAATGALRELGFPPERRHQEAFVASAGNPFADTDVPVGYPRRQGDYQPRSRHCASWPRSSPSRPSEPWPG